MDHPVLLCVAANLAESERVRAALAREGIATEVAEGDVLAVLEFGRCLRGFLELRVERDDLERARSILSGGTPCFGAEFLRELEALGGRDAVTRRFRYAGIQRLKTATREDVFELFHGSEYEVLQRIKKDSPADLARFLVRRFDQLQLQAQGAMMILFLGAMIH